MLLKDIKGRTDYFEILDNGEGLEETDIHYINRVLSREVEIEDENRYFGIRNVNERIKLKSS